VPLYRGPGRCFFQALVIAGASGRTAFRVAACAQRHGPGITNRETIARTARSDHSSRACKRHGPRKVDIRANSNADAGVDLILTLGQGLQDVSGTGVGYIKAGISDRVGTRRAGPTG